MRRMLVPKCTLCLYYFRGTARLSLLENCCDAMAFEPVPYIEHANLRVPIAQAFGFDPFERVVDFLISQISLLL